MPKKVSATISRSPKLVAVHMSGFSASTIGTDRIRQAIEHNIACNHANRCREADHTVLERVNCVDARARRRVAGVNLRLAAHWGIKVDVQDTVDGFEVVLTGTNAAAIAKSYTDAELVARLEAAVSCARANKCGTSAQSPKDQLNCVAVGAKRRLAIK